MKYNHSDRRLNPHAYRYNTSCIWLRLTVKH